MESQSSPTPILDKLAKRAPRTIDSKSELRRGSREEVEEVPGGVKAAVTKAANNIIRDFMLSPHIDGAERSISSSRLVKITRAVYAIASDSKHPQCIQAASILLDRVLGKPRPSEEEVEAISKGGVQLVYISRPEMEKVNTPELPAPVPDFVDAEVVSEG